MEHGTALIVQAEFFITPTDGSLSDLKERMARRIAEGERLKFAVRFFDTRGLVAKAVMQAHLAEARKEALFKVLSLSTDAGHVNEFGAPYQSSLEEFSVRRVDLRRCVIRELRFMTTRNLPVAIEQDDRTFRPMLENEYEALLKDVGASTGLWVFLFPPNNLLANEHTDSLSIM